MNTVKELTLITFKISSISKEFEFLKYQNDLIWTKKIMH